MSNLLDKVLVVMLAVCLLCLAGVNSGFLIADCADVAPTDGPCTSCDNDYQQATCYTENGGCSGGIYVILNMGLAITYAKGSYVSSANPPCAIYAPCELQYNIILNNYICAASNDSTTIANATHYISYPCPPGE